MSGCQGRGLVTQGLALLLALALVVGVVGNLTGSANHATTLGVLGLTPVLVLAGRGLSGPLNRLRPRTVAGLIGGGLLAILAVQLLVLITMPVTVYHDPFRVLAQAAHLATGHGDWTSTYFWRYSQNAPVTILLSWWFRLTLALGLTINLSLALLHLGMLDGLIGLLVATAWRLSRRPSVTLGTLAFCALTPFAYNYYLQVGYTDLPTLLVLALLARLTLAWPASGPRRHWVLGGALVTVAALGQVLKGNLIVIIPASLLVLLGLRWHPGRGRQLERPLVLICLGVLLAFPLTTGIERSAGFHHRNSIEFPLPSWIAMGYNQRSKGAFTNADVNRNLRHRTKASRQQNDLAVIKQRLTKPGPVKLGRLALAKLMIMTNDANVHSWYSGGMRAAPSWYLRHARLWTSLTVVIYQSATCALYLLVIRRLLDRQPGLGTLGGVVTAWLVLLALGYLAFHVLLWEVEERYGQVLLPLLLILLALNPPAREWPRGRLALTGVVLVATWLTGVTVNGVGLNSNLKTVTVAAQRSQLSAQYGARPWRLAPGQMLTQEVRLHGSVNYFAVQVHQGSRVRVTLVGNGQAVALRPRRDCYVYRKPLAAGDYRIIIRNLGTVSQPVDVTHVNRYRLAPHPLVTATREWPTASLVYDALNIRK